MKPLCRLASALLLASLALPSALRADSTPAPTPVCSVARDPQLVTPAGTLNVLDLASGEVWSWALPTRSAQPTLSVGSDVVGFAFLSAREDLVVAHSTPPRLTLHSDAEATAAEPLAILPADSVICGLAATDAFVVACIDHDQYLVFDGSGTLLDRETVSPVTDPNTPSWDGMAWDPNAQTLFAARVQGTARSAIAVPIGADGALGEAQVVPMDAAAAPLANELLALSPDASRLTAPDGLTLTTAPFALQTLPEEAGGDVMTIAGERFTVGAATTFGLSGCALKAETTPLSAHALLSPVLVRSAEWQGNVYLLRGPLASASLAKLRLGTGDLDSDHAPDAQDVFPLDPVVGKDWDHDGIPDKTDAFPTNKNEWQDTDGDGVGDNEDAFPTDPKEWKDSDHDGVGDNEDAFPFNPNEWKDSDGDGAGDNPNDPAHDAFPDDPLEQHDTDGDGVGDNGDAFPDDPTRWVEPFGAITAVFALELRQNAGLTGFKDGQGSRGAAVFALMDSNRFLLNLPSGEQLLGTTAPVGKSGRKLALEFSIASLSALELDFAPLGAAIVANDTANPPSPPLALIPQTVLTDGVLQFTKKGISLSLRARFAFTRGASKARGSHGGIIFRATGTPES